MAKRTEVEFGYSVRFTMTVRLGTNSRFYMVRDYGHRIAIDSVSTGRVVKVIKKTHSREPDKFTAMVSIRDLLDDKGRWPEDL